MFETIEILVLFSAISFLILANFIISKFWDKISYYLHLKKYKNVQKVHNNDISRLGGFLIITIYFPFIIFIDQVDDFFIYLLISFLPLYFISLKEDLYQNTSPIFRLFIMFITCYVYYIFNGTNFPIINFPLLNKIHTNYFLLIIFFIFSALIIINGSNVIDGMNGILVITLITQLISIFFISKAINDFEISKISILILIPLLIFTIFNYPLGKVFIGDTGAYFFGFSVSMIIIKLFGDNKELLSWNAVLILFYPSFELFFSFFRKLVYDKKNPLKADDLHLHSLIYKLGMAKKLEPKLMNNLVVIFICPMWLSPLIVIKIYDNFQMIIQVLLSLSLLYVLVYVVIRSYLNKYNNI